ncbi:MAG: phosphodiester glycosidase family protein [Anaerolineales bacterium]
MKQFKKLPRKRSDKRGRGKALLSGMGLGILIFCLCVTSALVIVPAVSPSTGAETADILRSVFGPAPVAVLESISFKFQDQLNQLCSKINGGQSEITFSPLPPPVEPTTTEVASLIPTTVNQVSTTSTPSLVQAIPTPIINVVTDSPQIGWQAYGPETNDGPVMARALIMPDPQRSYAGVVLVRIDLSKLQLHMVPGTLEPSHSSQVVHAIPNLGMVPQIEQRNLIAAFNGGFKAIHGRFGMMVSGVTLLPPIPSIATIAIYRDGHVQIGVWGQDLNVSSDMIAFRQNCPPLIDVGQINPALALENRKAWGYTDNTDITWRTGLGITQDSRYLIYAVGNGTSAETLADALQKAGAYNAMQLDINQFYAHFYTYYPSNPAVSEGFQLTGQRLVDQMINNPHLYLAPNVRDFFYLTTR